MRSFGDLDPETGDLKMSCHPVGNPGILGKVTRIPKLHLGKLNTEAENEPVGRGDSFWEPSFSGSMLIFGEVYMVKKLTVLEVKIGTTPSDFHEYGYSRPRLLQNSPFFFWTKTTRVYREPQPPTTRNSKYIHSVGMKEKYETHISKAKAIISRGSLLAWQLNQCTTSIIPNE